ncbi:MAG: TAXI family TRAP transporter solute-binding subunit [Rhodospirillales bacterium]|jgi:hypothetical protein|nr:hypothetical protein [Rhodospirillaceae bacterium]MDP6427031.1 TAXI family TRAP transporter solute-binding subunit [Rhodospirillales bacterium]MDP6646622.1 TAXI family TRAP transporter solute-binding subunit [Rhodospirillales bacterium]MDP6841910.1 TAXI family TRAP transporter solute-binding subunit [Rhodospirillales bacterium]|tara:strand:- start:2496 stop:3446 length:951 start_codon:yes stop_codon:yes gene_type:complete
MKVTHIFSAFGVAALIAGSASAQTVGIGTTKGGATAQVAAAISKTVSKHSGLQMRTQVMGGTQKYIPVVNGGELEFGISNIMQYFMAVDGSGLSAGHKYSNLRLAATMMTFRTGVLVAKNSGINTTADLRGKRVPSGFKGAPLFQFFMTSFLANGGLGWGDVKKVPQIGLRQHWNAFKQGKVDVVIGAVGSGAIKDMNAKVKGGVKYVSLSQGTKAATLKHIPKTGFREVKPAKPLVGVLKPTTIIAFDYNLWVNKGVSDAIVYKVVKAMYDNEKELKAAGPLWRSHFSKNMARDRGMPYHPGAAKFYKEVGIWKR